MEALKSPTSTPGMYTKLPTLYFLRATPSGTILFSCTPAPTPSRHIAAYSPPSPPPYETFGTQPNTQPSSAKAFKRAKKLHLSGGHSVVHLMNEH